MATNKQTTFLPKVKEIQREWYEADASQFVLGRLATKIARILRGKHKPDYTAHLDVGDFVVVTNPEKVKLTGRKIEQKEYHRYSGYPGGLKSVPIKKLLDNKPEEVLKMAVTGMLPKTRLGSQMIKRLKFAGDKHTYKIDHKIENK